MPTPFHARLLSGLLVLLLAGCSSLAPRSELPAQNAVTLAQGTVLDDLIGQAEAAHPGRSGFRLVREGPEAFAIRAHTALVAGRSLDVQTYIWHDDATGAFLAYRAIEAADRGVKVRLLVDDMDARGNNYKFAALAAHPNIEVRMFNPFGSRTGALQFVFEALGSFSRINRRMHMVGGRNIGDAYFGVSDGPNFRDADLVATGRAVDEAVGIFDSYWNSQSALPITTLHRIRRGNLPKLRKSIDRICAQTRARSFLAHLEDLKFPGMAKRLQDAIEVEAAEVIADPPEKAAAGRQDNWISTRIFDLIQSADRSLAVCSPYFIPGRSGLEIFAALNRRGVQSCILTNSLAATDVMIVHSAYAKYRKPLIAHGVELYEQRPDAGKRRMSLFGSSTASLHTKAMVADRRTGFVGSFNLDPRSVSINTEMGIIFTSPQLASELADLLDRQMRSSFRLALNDGSLYWIEPGTPAPRHHGGEPLTRLPRRLGAWAMSFLPIESQL